MHWYEKLIGAHLSVTDKVSHSGRLKSNRYFVWDEDGLNRLKGDMKTAESAVTGRTDLYTKTELDPWGPQLEAALDEAGIFWSRESVTYEEETGFWHWSWDWEVLTGPEDMPGYTESEETDDGQDDDQGDG